MKSPYPQPAADAPGDTAWFGGPIPWFCITLSITGADVDPAAISDLLGVAPVSASNNGDPLPATGTAGRRRSFGRWAIRLRREDTDEWAVEAAIGSVLDRVAVRGDIWTTAIGGARARILVGLALDAVNRGLCFPPGLLRRIADLQLHLDLDVYADDALNGIAGGPARTLHASRQGS